ncbi:MAG: sulfate adenylyltransferase subunit 1 (EFTu-like GTPase family) [Bermanella sp.]|jgi:sulfate adenylyltransferase subunit 1
MEFSKTRMTDFKQLEAESIHIMRIVTADGDLESAFVGQAITLTLEDEIDISRGDIICKTVATSKANPTDEDKLPTISSSFAATIVWMSEAALQPGKEYEFKVGTKNTFGKISKINHRIDVNTLDEVSAAEIQLNEIANCTIETASPVVIDEYTNITGTGSFIVIDRLTSVTVGAGMITQLTTSNIQLFKSPSLREYTEAEKALNVYIRKHYPEWGCKFV